jgi:hypothetical protein
VCGFGLLGLQSRLGRCGGRLILRQPGGFGGGCRRKLRTDVGSQLDRLGVHVIRPALLVLTIRTEHRSTNQA